MTDTTASLLREFFEYFEEDGSCRYDHHGYCQQHFLQDDCVVRRAAEHLEKLCGCGRCAACQYSPGYQPVPGDEGYIPG